MIRPRKIAILTVVLLGLLFSANRAEALIPFEFTIPETVGKIATWIQEKLAWVQLQISSINESKVARRIGDGIKTVKEVRDCIREFYRGGPVKSMADYFNTAEPSPQCKKYQENYGFLAGLLKVAGRTQLIIRELKDEDAYIVTGIVKNIFSDSELIVSLEKELEQLISDINDKAELDEVSMEAKINMAENDLNIMKSEHAKIWESASGSEKESMQGEENAIQKSIDKLRLTKAQIEPRRLAEIAEVTHQFLQKINEVKERRLHNSVLLDGYRQQRDKIRAERQWEYESGVDLAVKVKSEYSADIDVNDTIEKSLERREKIKNNITKLDISAMNESNESITFANDPANNPTLDADIGSTAEGKSEALQASIDNTLKQINAIEKIIKMELTSLELRTMEIISQNADHRLDHSIKNGENSLIIDFCRYNEGRRSVTKTKNNKNNSEDKDKPENKNNSDDKNQPGDDGDENQYDKNVF